MAKRNIQDDAVSVKNSPRKVQTMLASNLPGYFGGVVPSARTSEPHAILPAVRIQA